MYYSTCGWCVISCMYMCFNCVGTLLSRLCYYKQYTCYEFLRGCIHSSFKRLCVVNVNIYTYLTVNTIIITLYNIIHFSQHVLCSIFFIKILFTCMLVTTVTQYNTDQTCILTVDELDWRDTDGRGREVRDMANWLRSFSYSHKNINKTYMYNVHVHECNKTFMCHR